MKISREKDGIGAIFFSRNVLKQQPFSNNRVPKQYFPDDSLYRKECIKSSPRFECTRRQEEEGLKPLKGWLETSPPRGEIAIKREREGKSWKTL